MELLQKFLHRGEGLALFLVRAGLPSKRRGPGPNKVGNGVTPSRCAGSYQLPSVTLLPSPRVFASHEYSHGCTSPGAISCLYSNPKKRFHHDGGGGGLVPQVTSADFLISGPPYFCNHNRWGSSLFLAPTGGATLASKVWFLTDSQPTCHAFVTLFCNNVSITIIGPESPSYSLRSFSFPPGARGWLLTGASPGPEGVAERCNP